jgi:hypothetical protein
MAPSLPLFPLLPHFSQSGRSPHGAVIASVPLSPTLFPVRTVSSRRRQFPLRPTLVTANAVEGYLTSPYDPIYLSSANAVDRHPIRSRHLFRCGDVACLSNTFTQLLITPAAPAFQPTSHAEHRRPHLLVPGRSPLGVVTFHRDYPYSSKPSPWPLISSLTNLLIDRAQPCLSDAKPHRCLSPVCVTLVTSEALLQLSTRHL